MQDQDPLRRKENVIPMDCPQASEEKETRYAPYKERVREEHKRECRF